jgi:cellulose biosynthesis protein BcsQ
MICNKLKRLYAGITFDTMIELDARVREAQIMSMPVLEYNKESVAGQQYSLVAKEILSQFSGNQ